jgi:hypothetical protein
MRLIPLAKAHKQLALWGFRSYIQTFKREHPGAPGGLKAEVKR